MEVKFKEVVEEVRVPDLDKGGTKLVEKVVLKIEKSFGIDLKSSVENVATEEDKARHSAQFQAFLAEKAALADPVGELDKQIAALEARKAAVSKVKAPKVVKK